jgi:hypothetical protein
MTAGDKYVREWLSRHGNHVTPEVVAGFLPWLEQLAADGDDEAAACLHEIGVLGAQA